MQSTSSYSPLLHHETVAEYSAASSAPETLPNLGATALIGVGVFLLAIWSLSMMAGYKAHSAVASSPSSIVAASAYSDDVLLDLPPSFMPVACDRRAFYHWQSDCPLSKSFPRQSPVMHNIVHHKDRWMTRRKAELAGYKPCVYCAEINFWRTWRNLQLA